MRYRFQDDGIGIGDGQHQYLINQSHQSKKKNSKNRHQTQLKQRKSKQRGSPKQTQIKYSKLDIYPIQLLAICMVSTIITYITTILPSNLMFIGWLLHLIDFIVTSCIIVVSAHPPHSTSSQYNQIKQDPSLVMGYGYSYLFMYYFIFKYISIYSNSTPYISQTVQSVTHAHSHHSHAHTHMMGNPLCRNFLLQHCYSIVYYSSYMHATGLANMNKGKCFVLAVAFIVWNIYSTIQGNYVSKNFNTHIVDPELSDISLVSYAWVFNRNINKMFVCTCLYAFVTYAIGASASGRSYIHQSQTHKDASPKHNHSINLILQYRNMIGRAFVMDRISKDQGINKRNRSLILATASLCTMVYSCTRQLWQCWHIILVFLSGALLGTGNNHSRQFLRNRYIVVLFLYLATHVQQSMQSFLFGGPADSECQQVKDMVNFHITCLFCLVIWLMYISLQQYLVVPSSSEILQQICKSALISCNRGQGPNQTNGQADKFYSASVLLVKHTLMCLILAQLLVTFGVYSYVHEYTNSHVSDNAYFNNQGHFRSQDKHSLYVNESVRYIFIVVILIFSYLLISLISANRKRDARLQTVYVSSQQYSKLVNRTISICLMICVAYPLFTIAKQMNLTPETEQMNFIFPSCSLIQNHNNLYQDINGCKKLLLIYNAPLQIALLIESLILTLYVTLQRRYADPQRHISFLLSLLYWAAVLLLYVLMVVGIHKWECIGLGYFYICLLFAMVIYVFPNWWTHSHKFKYK